MFLGALAISAAVAILFAFAVLSLFVGLRRAAILAPLIVGSGIAGAGVGFVAMTVVAGSDGSPSNSTHLLVYFGGIALFSMGAAACGAWLGLKAIK